LLKGGFYQIKSMQWFPHNLIELVQRGCLLRITQLFRSFIIAGMKTTSRMHPSHK